MNTDHRPVREMSGARRETAFTDAELRFLRDGPRLARIATTGSDGTPHVVPVGWRYDPRHDAIETRGHDLTATKKFRDVVRSGRAAIVIDDLESTDPWRPRAIAIRGRAEAITEPEPLIRIYPDRVISWGLGERPR